MDGYLAYRIISTQDCTVTAEHLIDISNGHFNISFLAVIIQEAALIGTEFVAAYALGGRLCKN